jgi:hypothetical protein
LAAIIVTDIVAKETTPRAISNQNAPVALDGSSERNPRRNQISAPKARPCSTAATV